MRKKETINMVKSMDRGSLEFKTHESEHDGDVMSIAKKEVVTAPQSATIKEATEIMVKNKFRRLPITDPGTGKLRGIVTAMDVLNFLGGGDKYKLLEDYRCFIENGRKRGRRTTSSGCRAENCWHSIRKRFCNAYGRSTYR